MTPRRFSSAPLQLGLVVSALLVLGACSSKSLQRAPVEDRSRSANSAPTRTIPATRQAIGRDNLGKPGYYEVQAGDNLFRIGRNFGRSVAELARWNGLSDPYIIEIGDVLRVSPSPSTAPAGTSPVPSSTSSPAPTPAETPQINWIWPATGPILQGFDPAKNKGVDIAGKAGDPVLAAGDGSVVYAGSALRGYGNLVIIKHGTTFVSAYAHNQTLLVKEGQSVKRGQKIAEMGQSEADRVKLHFEIRKNNTPVDPMQYLPAR
jgi:lipoprotein NlpD